jgi:hypothetical protein
LSKVHREIKQLNQIESNMIVRGLPAAVGNTEDEKTAHDKTIVEALVTELGLQASTVSHHKRFATKDNNPSLMLVEFDDPSFRFHALRGAKNLRGNE